MLRPAEGARFAIWSTKGSQNWTEGTVTWNNGPRRDQKISTTNVTSDGRYWDFNIMAWLDFELKATDGGLRLVSPITLWVQGVH
jgi:hypothetical protein